MSIVGDFSEDTPLLHTVLLSGDHSNPLTPGPKGGGEFGRISKPQRS